MIIKLMRPDRTFELIDTVKKASFRRSGDGAFIDIEHDNAATETRAITDRAYALNGDGRTIDTFIP